MRNLELESQLSALQRHLVSPLSYWRTLSATKFFAEAKVVETSVASLISVSRLAPPELIGELLAVQYEERVPVWNDLAAHFFELDRMSLGLCWDVGGSCTALSAQQLDPVGLVRLLKALCEPYITMDPELRIQNAATWLAEMGTLLNPTVLSQADWFQPSRGFQTSVLEPEEDGE